MSLLRVISGGQTGIDRAALDAALSLGIPIGGWCPRDRRALDGRIPDRYPLRETPSSGWAQRTSWNVRDSDGTLVLTFGSLSGGTARTVSECRRQRKPYLVVDLSGFNRPSVSAWLRHHGISVLNVAGPRERSELPVHELARVYLEGVLCSLSSLAGRQLSFSF